MSDTDHDTEDIPTNQVSNAKLGFIFVSTLACIFNMILFHDLILHQLITDKELYDITTITYFLSLVVVNLFSMQMNHLNELKNLKHYWILTGIFLAVSMIHITVRMAAAQIFDPVKLAKLVFTHYCIVVPLFLTCQLSTLKVYISVPYYALKSKLSKKSEEQQYYCNLMVEANADTGLLGLLDACLRAVPVQIFQFAIFIRSGCDLKTFSWIEEIAILGRTCLLGLPATSFQSSLRQQHPEKNEMEMRSMLWYCFSNFCIIFGRCLCLGAAAAVWPSSTTILVVLHCTGWAFWLWWTHKPLLFYNENRYLHILFCLVIGVVYNCVPINLRDGPTRSKYVTFYGLMTFENVLGLLILYYETDKVYLCQGIVLLLSVIAIFVGVVFQGLYYEKYHPNKVAKISSQKLNDV